MRTSLLWTIGVLVLVGVIGSVWWYRKPPITVPALVELGTPPPAVRDTTRTAPSGYKEYRNTTYRMSLFYPDTLIVKEFNEGGGAQTITFEGKGGIGFQIFVVPYTDAQLTPERLKKDIPSGVVKEQTPIVIDGKAASMFYSTNALLGETREVWFIQNKYLYEVTTTKDQDAWLSTIMKSWMFL